MVVKTAAGESTLIARLFGLVTSDMVYETIIYLNLAVKPTLSKALKSSDVYSWLLIVSVIQDSGGIRIRSREFRLSQHWLRPVFSNREVKI